MMMLVLLGCVLGGGSTKETVDPMCENICDELVYNCSYAAFPTHQSCLEGCLYSAEEGGNNDEYYTCLQEAACDTFKVVECENAHGMNAEN